MYRDCLFLKPAPTPWCPQITLMNADIGFGIRNPAHLPLDWNPSEKKYRHRRRTAGGEDVVARSGRRGLMALAPDGRVSRFAVDVRTDSGPGEIRSHEESLLSEGLRIEHGSAPTPDAYYSLDAIASAERSAAEASRRDWAWGCDERQRLGGTGRPAVPTTPTSEARQPGPESARFHIRGVG